MHRAKSPCEKYVLTVIKSSQFGENLIEYWAMGSVSIDIWEQV